MHILIALAVAAVILFVGFRLSLVAPRWVQHSRRTAVMLGIWALSFGVSLVPVMAAIR